MNTLSITQLRLLILPLFLFCLPLYMLAQVAPVNPPNNHFNINGQLKSAAGIGDWLNATIAEDNPAVMNKSGVLSYTGDAFNTNTSGRVTDAYTSSDNIFTNGSKFNDYIGDLRWFTNSAPDKNDIHNGLFHVSTNVTLGTGIGDQWLFIAGDRLSTNGTSYIDFELLQNTVTMTANGFTGGGPNGGRTENDINISMEYTNGGTKPLVVIYRWKLGKSNVYFWDSTGTSAITQAFAETNRTGTADVPFGAFGNTSYAQYAFVEAAVNMTQLLGSGTNCAGITIKTIWIKTKASASSTAALKDFMNPIPVSLTFGDADISAAGPLCIDADPVKLQATPAGGVFSGTGVSLVGADYYFNPANADQGIHEITYTVQVGIGCQRAVKENITVNAKPTVGVNSQTVCADNLPATITATPGSGAAGDYNYTWTIPANAAAPGNVSSFSTSVGGDYKVTITHKTTGCVSTQATGTLTVNPEPVANAGNAPAGQCIDTEGNVFTLAGSGENGTAKWTVKTNVNGLTVGFDNDVSYTSDVTISGGSGQVVLLLTVTSNQSPSCGTATSEVTLTVYALPVAVAGTDFTKTCVSNATGKVIGETAEAGHSYSWSPSTGLSATNISNPTANPQTNQTYTVTKTNTTTGCSAQDQITVTVDNAVVTANAGNDFTKTCTSNTSGLAIGETNDDAYTYSWLPVAGLSNAAISNPVANPSATETFTVTKTHKITGCFDTDEVIVTVNTTPPTFSVCLVQPTLCASTGSVTFSASGGTGFEYSINGGTSWSGNNVFSPLASGSVTGLKVKNSFGCISDETTCVNITSDCGNAIASVNRNIQTDLQESRITTQYIEMPGSEPTIKAFPNPYNDRIRFVVSAPEAGQGSLEVHNMLGQKVKTVYQGMFTVGTQNFDMMVPNSQQSTLIYVLRINGKQVSGKMLQVK